MEEENEEEKGKSFHSEPQENILYFIEKNAPELAMWKREIIRIARNIAQYFYPQPRTKVLNEGFASFVHYYMMQRLFEQGLITEGSWLEFLDLRTRIQCSQEEHFSIHLTLLKKKQCDHRDS